MRLKIVALALALVGCGAGFTVSNAVETAAGSSIIVEKLVNDDFIAAGRDVLIRGAVAGDIALAGDHVALEEAVDGYAIIAGRNIDVNGRVRNDLWAAGSSVELNGDVGDNAMLAGGEVVLGSSAVVRGDARIAGGSVGIHAPIERNLKIAARTATISSEVGGAVTARVQRLRVLPGALIRGDIIVSGSYPPEISPEAKVLGQVQFNDIAARNEWSWLWWWLFAFAALLILGFAALALAPVWPEHVAGTIRESPGTTAVTGLLGVLLTPVVAGFFLVTVIGIPVGIILLAFYVIAVMLSGVFVAYLIGDWLLERIGRADTSRWMRMAFGVLVVSVLISLPWISGIAQLVILVVGFGALILERRRSGRPPQPAAALA